MTGRDRGNSRRSEAVETGIHREIKTERQQTDTGRQTDSQDTGREGQR